MYNLFYWKSNFTCLGYVFNYSFFKMRISITEFNDNISFFIGKSKHEPVELTKRGILVAAIINRFNYEKIKNSSRPGETTKKTTG